MQEPWVSAVRVSRALFFRVWLDVCGSLDFVVYFGFVGLVGVHLYRSIGLEKSSPRADDHGFGHHGAAREHAGEEDDVGSFCTKAWPVVVVVHIYIHIQF